MTSSSSSRDTRVTCLASALSRAADRIVARFAALAEDGARTHLSKNTVLNDLAVAIAGPGHDWGFLKNRPDGVLVQPGLDVSAGKPTPADTVRTASSIISPGTASTAVWAVIYDEMADWAPRHPALFLDRTEALAHVRADHAWWNHVDHPLETVISVLEKSGRYVFRPGGEDGGFEDESEPYAIEIVQLRVDGSPRGSNDDTGSDEDSGSGGGGARVFQHTPETCPSKHWNDGSDICADCGLDLHDAGDDDDGPTSRIEPRHRNSEPAERQEIRILREQAGRAFVTVAEGDTTTVELIEAQGLDSVEVDLAIGRAVEAFLAGRVNALLAEMAAEGRNRIIDRILDEDWTMLITELRNPAPAPRPFAGEPAGDLLEAAVNRVEDELELELADEIELAPGSGDKFRRAVRAVAIAFVREKCETLERYLLEAGLDALAPMVAEAAAELRDRILARVTTLD